MSNVVQFLEALARNPKHMSADQYAALVVDAGLDPTTKRALLDHDVAALNETLTSGRAFACLIFPAENEPNDGEEKQDDGETPEEPQEQNSLAA